MAGSDASGFGSWWALKGRDIAIQLITRDLGDKIPASILGAAVDDTKRLVRSSFLAGLSEQSLLAALQETTIKASANAMHELHVRRKAFDIWWVKTGQKRSFRIAYSFLENHDSASDVVQEVYIKLSDACDRLGYSLGDICNTQFRSTYNEVVNFRRLNPIHVPIDTANGDGLPLMELIPDPVSAAYIEVGIPASDLLREVEMHLMGAMDSDRLDFDDIQAWTDKTLYDWRTGDIAAAQGVTDATVSLRISKVNKYLANSLNSELMATILIRSNWIGLRPAFIARILDAMQYLPTANDTEHDFHNVTTLPEAIALIIRKSGNGYRFVNICRKDQSVILANIFRAMCLKDDMLTNALCYINADPNEADAIIRLSSAAAAADECCQETRANELRTEAIVKRWKLVQRMIDQPQTTLKRFVDCVQHAARCKGSVSDYIALCISRAPNRDAHGADSKKGFADIVLEHLNIMSMGDEWFDLDVVAGPFAKQILAIKSLETDIDLVPQTQLEANKKKLKAMRLRKEMLHKLVSQGVNQ